MDIDRLLILDPQELTLRFEIGRKSAGVLQLRNVMETMSVAFKIQTSAPKKYTMKPSYGVIEPLSVMSVEIIMTAQNELPSTFPRGCDDMFTVKSVDVPRGYNKESYCSLSIDWFTAKKKHDLYFSDTSLRIFFIGGGILRNLITRGCMDEVREVLERDPEVADASDENGESSMHVAISMNKPELVQLLLLFKVNLEVQNKAGQTPLHQAAHAGEALITELLLANGADTDARTDSGWTALHYATVKGNLDVMKLLIDYGADPDAQIRDDGRTAVHIAVAEGHKHCLELLLDKGCNVDARRADGGTALHTAAARGHVAFVTLLLQKGAITEVKNCQGRTPYDDAVDSGQTVLFDMLLLGHSMRQSARAGELKDVKKFVKDGAAIDGKDQYGWTALHQAAFKGRVNVVKFLIEKGADLKHEDEEGYNALHTAVESGQKDVVQLLVVNGANVNEKTRRGLTPLDVATNLNYMGIVRILVEAGASRDALSSVGDEFSEFVDANFDNPETYGVHDDGNYVGEEIIQAAY